MKQTPQIRVFVAAGAVALGILAPPAAGIAADATRPNYQYRSPSSDPNGNDYHANYHADYSATQDGRPSQPAREEERRDPRQDSRKFQDGNRSTTQWPYGGRR
jgi:hypothetical protein